jgi:hypothetical protein
VHADVLDGYVSVVAAELEYGVAFDATNLRVDVGATAQLRDGRRSE